MYGLFSTKQYEIDSKEKLFIIAPTMVKCCRVICTRNWFWDTFRALYPLLNLVYPSINKEMQEGLINDYKEGGFYQNGQVRF
jgi:putative alpha-1,2-mannosidase